MERTVEINMKELFSDLMRRKRLILLCAIVAAGMALLFTICFITPLYRSSVTFRVNNYSDVVGSENRGEITASDLDTSERLIPTYLEIIKSNGFLTVVSENLDHQFSVLQLDEMISAEKSDTTTLFYIHISHSDANVSAKIANVIAQIVEKEIPAKIPGSSVDVIDYAKAADEPYTPSYMKNTLIGAVIGALIAFLAIAIRVVTNVRVKSEEDLKRICDAPVLGLIPDYDSESDAEPYARYILNTEDMEKGEA